jgi:hypothetical protein
MYSEKWYLFSVLYYVVYIFNTMSYQCIYFTMYCLLIYAFLILYYVTYPVLVNGTKTDWVTDWFLGYLATWTTELCSFNPLKPNGSYMY